MRKSYKIPETFRLPFYGGAVMLNVVSGESEDMETRTMEPDLHDDWQHFPWEKDTNDDL